MTAAAGLPVTATAEIRTGTGVSVSDIVAAAAGQGPDPDPGRGIAIAGASAVLVAIAGTAGTVETAGTAAEKFPAGVGEGAEVVVRVGTGRRGGDLIIGRAAGPDREARTGARETVVDARGIEIFLEKRGKEAGVGARIVAGVKAPAGQKHEIYILV